MDISCLAESETTSKCWNMDVWVKLWGKEVFEPWRPNLWLPENMVRNTKIWQHENAYLHVIHALISTSIPGRKVLRLAAVLTSTNTLLYRVTVYLETTHGLYFKTPKFPHHVIISRYFLDEENPYMQKKSICAILDDLCHVCWSWIS